MALQGKWHPLPIPYSFVCAVGKAIVRNSRYAGAVHQNVRIMGNTFQKYGGVCISAKATFLQTKKDKNSKLQARCNGIKHCLTEALHTE